MVRLLTARQHISDGGGCLEGTEKGHREGDPFRALPSSSGFPPNGQEPPQRFSGLRVAGRILKNGRPETNNL
jgi:hypothetical protein